MTKYKLNIWQMLELIPLFLIWLFTEKDKRKSWHMVKKGIEKHECKFTKIAVVKGIRILECEHEGCNMCEIID